ncbi:MetQ/NlpA family ABC transporter substrate-binding protein [Fusobacterium sp. PH5-44]|uniref:MetQ/NlpA family ABC transporter substrate-binding protein n=1 Tax=unclassified Fusobacterium TaxID=2648384 RepID=UPI003D1D81C4
MKKLLIAIVSVVLSLSASAGILKIGATPVPHSELLELIKDDLKADGVELKIIEFTDYVTPNIALSDGELDANFFQHVPYMVQFAEERNLKLASAGKIHVEPLGVYSAKHKKLEELPEKATIAIPNDATNGGRALILLHNNNIIKLKDPTNLSATELDVIENPKNFKFQPLEAAQLPRSLTDVDAAIINGNYALDANLNPLEDALLLEDKESPYVNIITVRTGDENKEDIQKLIKALHSEKIKNFIKEKYKGGVVPAF